MAQGRREGYKGGMSTIKRSAATRLHVLIMDPSFYGGERPGSTRTFTICRELTHTGHHATILTAPSDQPTKQDDGGGFTILTTGKIVQAQFGHPMSARARRSYILRAFWRIWCITDVDIVVVVDRPLLILPVAALFCAVRGVPLTIDAYEGIPLSTSGSPPGQRVLTWIVRAIYKHALRYARRIFVQSAHVQTSLITSGAAAEKIVEAPTGCETLLLRPSSDANGNAAKANAPAIRGPVVAYAGHLGANDAVDAVIDIAAKMQSLSPNVAFLFYCDGPGRREFEARALKLGVLNKNVWVLNPVPRARLSQILAAATAMIGRNQNDSVSAPSRHVFDALAAERPVIFLGENPHRDLVVGRGAGITLPLQDAQAAAHELSDFLSNADGLRRARQQAAALAAGRLNTARITAEIRSAIESTVEEAPRAAVARRRMLRTKRAIDIFLSLGALIVLSPVLIGVAIAVRVKMGAPIIFSQERPGLRGKLFRIYKFRTMTDAMGAARAALPDSERLTPLGRFMRRTSLDELPELINVLKGDMSLVGPRPLLPDYLSHYSPEQWRRHDVLPGITGWTQVSGRNALTWEEKFALDVWYVDNLSLWLDIKISLKTVLVALRGNGVNAPGCSTMPRFDEIMARREGAEDA